MDALPHYKFFNDSRLSNPDAQLLDIPDEEKANWIMFECRFEAIDGFHRKGVRYSYWPLSCECNYNEIASNFAGMARAHSQRNAWAAKANHCHHSAAQFNSSYDFFFQ
jgi:hypothetical protein